MRELVIVSGIMAGLVALFLTLVLSRTLIEPAQDLTRVAGALASGDLSARTRSEREDELGEIGRGLDRMADQLEDRIIIVGGTASSECFCDWRWRRRYYNASPRKVVRGWTGRRATAGERNPADQLHSCMALGHLDRFLQFWVLFC